MAPQDSVEEIKNRLDIKEVISDYIRVEKSGINYRALCPFHQEKTPSFFISPTRQIWRCFGCGVGGDMFTFVQQIEGSDFPEALQMLAKKAGVEIRRQDPRVYSAKNKSLEICELTAKYFRHSLLESKNGQRVAEYLKERGINEKAGEEFMLGYASSDSKKLLELLDKKGYSLNDVVVAGVAFKIERSGEYVSRYRDRIIFPIFNTNGNVVAFGARKLPPELAEAMGKSVSDEAAKYINSPQTNIYDKSNILYGLDKAKIAIRQSDSCIIVEGYTDVILAHQEGFKNVVASSGTALTENQLDLIGRFTKNLLTSFDMDSAGDLATRRGIELAQSIGFDVKVISLDSDSDPAEIIAKDPKQWEKALENTKSITQFYFDSTFGKFDSKTAEGKREIVKEIAPILKNIPSKIEQAHWVQEAAVRLGSKEDIIWEDIKNFKEDSNKSVTGKKEKPPKEKPSRKAGLKRQILVHIFKKPELIEHTINTLSDINSEDNDLQILYNIQKAEKKNIVDSLEGDDKKFVEELLFESEAFPQEYSEQGLNSLLVEYRKIILDEEKSRLEGEINEGESQGKDVSNLIEMFQQKAQQRSKLN
ncbi:MAG: DNA primase [Candidatus Spechtbacterales bacterium]